MGETEQRTAEFHEEDVDLREVNYVGAAKTAVVVTVVGLAALPLVMGSSYLSFVALSIMIFGIMATGYNVMLGWSRLLVFCPAALAIIGGVTSVLLMKVVGVPFLVALLAGGTVAGLTGVGIAYSAIIIKSPFEIVIATLAFEQLVFYLLVNWDRVGSNGIRNIPDPSIGMALTTQIEQYLLLLGVLTVAIFLVATFDRSLTGILTIATSEDEDLVQSIGYSPSRYKLVSIVLGAFLLGIGGSMYAHINGLITPGQFTIDRSVLLVVIVVVGGLRSVRGPIVGAIIMIGLPEVIRSFGLGRIRPFLVGLTLIGIVLFLPKGVLGTFYEWYENRREGLI